MGEVLVDIAEVCIIYFHIVKFVSKHINKCILFQPTMQLYKLSM